MEFSSVWSLSSLMADAEKLRTVLKVSFCIG